MSFDKTGYQLILFPLWPSTADNTNNGNGSVLQKNHFFKPVRVKGFGANRLVKNLQQKDRIRPFCVIFETFERKLQQHLSALWSGVQQTDSC